MASENNRKIFEKYLIRLKVISSTNTFAVKLLENDPRPPDGTVIFTNFQTDGKGHGGAYWESEPSKNILMSLILYPKFLKTRDFFQLSQVISLGLCTAIQSVVDEPVTIKWPNDIYVGKCKIAGILIQNSLSSNNWLFSIVGIGINVNQVHFKNAPNPISLAKLMGKQFPIDKFRKIILDKLSIYYDHLKQGNVNLIRKEYFNALFRKGEEAKYRKNDGVLFTGTILGVGPQGRLQVATAGEITEYDFKEIEYII